MTTALIEKKYIRVVFFAAIDILVYLYSGHKSYLFSIPLVLILVLWSKRKKFVLEFSKIFSIGFSFLVLSAFYNEIAFKIYSLIGRRVMIVSANNKFKYYDFFSSNPKIGIYGIFPQWLIESQSPYKNDIGHIISEIYYQKPDMNSNTGFLAEGFMRFGILGIPLTLIVFALILRQIDQLQK
ncbi:hypothetical protein ACKKL3_004368, partial [Shigella flexneri]